MVVMPIGTQRGRSEGGIVLLEGGIVQTVAHMW